MLAVIQEKCAQEGAEMKHVGSRSGVGRDKRESQRARRVNEKLHLLKVRLWDISACCQRPGIGKDLKNHCGGP